MFTYGCIKEKKTIDKSIMKIYIFGHKFIDMMQKEREGAETNIIVGKGQHIILSVITKRIYIQ